jgi:SRSO17 transposase
MKGMEKELQPAKDMLGKYFTREETRKSAVAYFHGLLTKTERKNSWQLSEQAGLESPYAFQYLLGRALWNEDLLRNDTRNLSVSHLGKKESVLSVDETGFLKKGDKSVGVGRQYSGTAGKIENCQIGVFLSYATAKGRALIDRELYIPQEWYKNKTRCRAAGIPEKRKFMTKPELAREMLARTLESGVKPEWVAGDEVYGCYMLRDWLELRQQGYVLAVASNSVVSIGRERYTVTEVLNCVPKKQWKLLSAGSGTKGERYYEWMRIKIDSDSPAGWSRWLLFRRNVKKPDEVAFYIAFCSDKKSLLAMVKAAGTRWTIEECFEMAKGETGLDHYEVRSWTGWYRHITLSMFALSFLVKLRSRLNKIETAVKKKIVRRSPMKKFLESRGLVA